MALCCAAAHADETIDFGKQIAPIFAQHCIDCHGPDEQESQFRLDRRSTMLAGGDSGEPSVVPGEPESSFLLKLIRRDEPGMEMPPDESLAPQQVDLIERWIAGGAETPESYGPAKERAVLTHWSFQPIKRVESGSVDSFIRRKLTENGLTLSDEADRHVLIRRLYLVMLGIPPTPEQVDAFVNDDRENAWPELVEEVLASKHYGERIATFWLDLVRFGETHGFEMNRERPTAWHYRDWVIQSFNDDKPYDDFIREQIAGDALGADVATGFLVAGPVDQVKGSDPKLQQMQRMNELDDFINTTGTAMLGLTTGCARCHNHKFDPISQRDYYALQAVFAGVQHGDRPLPLSQQQNQRLEELDAEIEDLTNKLKPFIPKSDSNGRVPVNARRNDETFVPRTARFVRFTIDETTGGEGCIDELEIYAGQRNVALADSGAIATSSGDFVHPKHKLSHINDGQYGNDRSWIVKSNANGWVQIELAEPIVIDRIVWGRDRNGDYRDRLPIGYRIESAVEEGHWELVASSSDRQPYPSKTPADENYVFDGLPRQQAEQGRAWLDRLQVARREKAELKKSTLVYAGTFAQPGPTYRLYRGEPDAKREQVGPDAMEAFTSLNLDLDAPEQRRRLALADWIASDDNPLTARVMVNRIWQFHFGTGIVDTPSDFGRNGTPPSHPELLDWLANELIENGWSLKHLHRTILMSQTWRQNSQPDAAAMRVDAASRLLWRFPTRRLEAEAIRDSILAVTGVLNLQDAGGPGFDAFEVEMENVRHYYPKKSYGPEDWRRMIYMTKVRQEREHVFGAFDCPDASMVVPRRSRSTTPLQALNLFNSDFVMQQADLLAERLENEGETAAQRIARAWLLCFQRPVTAEELAESETFIQREGMRQFARAMLNANELVFIP
jgi:mono/diheme cytochrome c family protein